MVNTQLNRIVQALARHDVPYVIIGGHAVNAHGYIRATEDTDVIYQRTMDKLNSRQRLLQEKRFAFRVQRCAAEAMFFVGAKCCIVVGRHF